MNDYRLPGELREEILRKQGIEALLKAATKYMTIYKSEADIPAGRFLIYLMWAVDSSPDGITFEIKNYPNKG